MPGPIPFLPKLAPAIGFSFVQSAVINGDGSVEIHLSDGGRVLFHVGSVKTRGILSPQGDWVLFLLNSPQACGGES